ncbi:UPF0696 protein [Colletotrichum chlorophyti]|uniref:UPF0696 protein n=1 Tax=Colletotrichum chlorophyti TaxID=708187 RepID=A0A1Q8S103_9PEZI|nr:UPF0696 protein [Colletotrichum chlorophyti]
MDMSSDESDFYGDEETVAGLESRVTSFDVNQWWKETNAVYLNQGIKKEIPNNPKLHNPYARVPYAWQLTETIDEFLTRLPPKTTKGDDDLPWIFICNPYIQRKDRAAAQNQLSRGNEDEAPEEEDSHLDTLIEGGTERLQILGDFMEGIKKTRKAQAVQTREVNQEKRNAVQDILRLANACKIRSGKASKHHISFLLQAPKEVNEVWRIIAKATANNELGIAAKVARWNPERDPTGREDRIVCVYTADFSDTGDVARVLRRLRELRVVEAKGRPIYYKPDAFTYIGIAYGNPWDIKASIYSSMDTLANSHSPRSRLALAGRDHKLA